MYPIDLSGKKGVVFGVANDRSIAWAISRILGEAGAQLALTYQNDRLKDRVSSPGRYPGRGYCRALRRLRRPAD